MLQQLQHDETFAAALGKTLIGRGLIKPTELDRAHQLQDNSAERLDRLLTKLGLVSDRDMAETLAACLNLPMAGSDDYPTEALMEDQASATFFKHARIIPIADKPEGVMLAMVDPLDRLAIDGLSLRLGKPVLPLVALPEDVDVAYERLYGSGSSAIEQILGEDETSLSEDAADDIERLRDLASEAPVIRLVNHLIGKAVEMQASDIHIEPFERYLSVRYRIDGVLRDVQSPPNRLRSAVVSRVKIMANLNIAENRLPQDGRIKLAIRGNKIDLRISTVPTLHGESVVLRILDQDAVAPDFATLGLDTEVLDAFLDILDRPNGLLLVTGPTGSGKTTTLYTSLRRLNTGESKILTVEDPIEYQLDGINQTQVKSQIGLDFAHLLRTFLRQDPDIIMIGEIRDLETAQIAVQAALTGHLVLSTLHTNDAASTITRLLDMGVDDFLIASTLNGIVAQRLVRTLCLECREAYQAPPELVARFDLKDLAGDDGSLTLYRPRGCNRCSDTGFRGRISILEILVMSDSLRGLIQRGADARELQRVAVAEGMRPIYQDGLQKALAGVTTIQEVLRVAQAD